MKYHILLIFFFTNNVLFSQAFPDRHSTNLEDCWLSCQTSANPNPARSQSHWIMYNLGDTYSLNKSTIWNLNVPERINSYDNQAWSVSRLPGRTEDGMKDIIIDISVNGTTWTEWGRFTIPKASASGFYQGVPGPDFLGKVAKYILITGVSNHGGPCFGLSEIKFNGTVVTVNSSSDLMDGVMISAAPNPLTQVTTIQLSGLPSGEISIDISDITGRQVKSFTHHVRNNTEEFILNRDGLPSGLYTLKVTKNDAVKTIKIQIQ
jgi:hypothetical protein